MQTLILLLLTGIASAHMPVFNDDLYGKDIHSKSYAVYESMKAGDELLLRLNISEGQNFSVSVNMAGSQAFEEGVQYVNVTVTGHNAESIECDRSRCSSPALYLPESINEYSLGRTYNQ